MSTPKRMISPAEIEEANRRKPLVKLVGEKVDLKKGFGGLWGLCPFHNEKTPSFKVDHSGRYFICFGCDAKGDAIAFTRKTQGLSFPDAVKWLLGTEPGLAPVKHSAPKPQDDNGNRNIEFGRKIWQASQRIEGTDAERYLRGRGIAIPLPPSLRFHPGLKHTPTGLMFSALIAAIQGPDGKITSIQRIYLLPGGAGKARVSTPKMALGRISGGAVRLSAMTEHLALCEGIEDGLSILQERPDLTVWATLGTSGMSGVKLPDSVLEVTLCPDADEAGERAAQEASSTLARDGRVVRIARPPPGLDWNDLLNAPENVAFLDQHRRARHVG